MLKHVQSPDSPAVATPAHQQAKMPEFTFAPLMGRKSIDEIETDLLLITVLSGMVVPKGLRAESEDAGAIIKSAIKANGFAGKCGEQLLVDTDLPDSAGASGRRVLLAGLGRPEKFCGRTAYQVFELLIEEAIRLGVRRVTIPFTPNRGTGSCLTMKGMGHKLSTAVSNCINRHSGLLELEEVQIYCTPQAKAHIQKGLDVSSGECPCSGN